MRAKWAKRMILALAASAMLSPPLMAQSKSDGYKFLEAVKKRDGDEATNLLSQPGSTLVNARDLTSGENALHIVAQRRDAVWIKFLLQKGADPNLADKRGITPLQIAARLGFVEGVEALLDGGAQVDVPNTTGETPLISAVHRRDTVMIRLLIEKGANPDHSDNSGRTARDYAKLLGNNSQVLAEIERAEKAKGEKQRSYGPN